MGWSRSAFWLRGSPFFALVSRATRVTEEFQRERLGSGVRRIAIRPSLEAEAWAKDPRSVQASMNCSGLEPW
jgi:hypothetical protein